MTQHWVLNEISQGEAPTILPQQVDFDYLKVNGHLYQEQTTIIIIL